MFRDTAFWIAVGTMTLIGIVTALEIDVITAMGMWLMMVVPFTLGYIAGYVRSVIKEK